MDTYLLQRAGFTAQAKEIEAAAEIEAYLKSEDLWLEGMYEKYPPLSQEAQTVLRQHATVDQPVPMEDISLDGIDLEQAHDQLYALSSIRDSGEFSEGYQAIRIRSVDDEVAILVIGLVKRAVTGKCTGTYKFLVAVIGASREELEEYAESVRPETPLESFKRELKDIDERYKPRPHETSRRERAARIARLLDKKVRYILVTLVVAAIITVVFSHVSAFAAALSFVLVFCGSLLGSRLVHNVILRRAGLPHHDNACWQGHRPPPLRANSRPYLSDEYDEHALH